MARRTFMLNAIKLKSLAKLRIALKHNLRENDREIAFSDSIDPQRKHLNVIMVGPGTCEGIIAKQKDLLNAVTSLRLKKDGSPVKVRVDAVHAIEFVFSLQPDSGVDEVRFFEKALEWIEQQYRVPVLSAVVHRDEGGGHPHMHAVVLPVRDGAMIGSAMLGLYAKMQASFYAKVGSLFNLTYEVRPTTEVRQHVANRVMAALFANPDVMKSSEFQAWLFGAIMRSPSRLLELVGVPMPLTPPATKTWIKTLTRPTKPDRTSRGSEKPIGLDSDHYQNSKLGQTKPYPVLGFDLLAPHFVLNGSCQTERPAAEALYIVVATDGPTAPSRDDHTHQRVSDELPAIWFDERTGEFVLPSATRKSDKAGIIAAVELSLMRGKA
jgi:hypothetical protein